ncbi:MAG: toxin TcdB middle/C-terminal domain-containing protein, partial [Mucilaginibacter sp.]
GTPWVTRLPFPVQCVSETATIDNIAGTRFTSQYSYHHGYYDHAEREFRGFGRVDQTDTEDFEQFKKHAAPQGIQLVQEDFHQPPVLIKTWFHTGAFLDKEKILDQFAHEYYQNSVLPEKQPIDPPLPPGLTSDEWREALRTCKGITLRREVYTPDGSNKQDIPYTTASASCLIQLIQPRQQNPYSVWIVQQSEALTYTYERNPADPRIAHSMTLETDAFGNVLKSAAISYGRKTVDTNLNLAEQAVQGKTHIIYTQNNVTNIIDSPAACRLPVPFEAMTSELAGLIPVNGDYFGITEMKTAADNAAIIAYEALPAAGKQEKRLIEQSRSLYLKDDLSGPLALGVIESLALPYQSYKLALTPGLRDNIFGGKVSDDLLLTEGRYAHFNDGNYWIAGGTSTLDAANFYQVTAVTDPFGFSAQISYDNSYRFFVEQTTDAIGNSSRVAGFNYRTLSPYLMQDINDNRAGVRTDELGMVIASFAMGKTGENKGDQMDVTSAEATATDQPGGTMEYDLFNYINTGKPNFTTNTVQETHYFDLQNGTPSLTQISYAYASGSGAVIMQKKQAEPGLALQENEDGTVTTVDTTPNLRWIGNGRTILNNKGKPVKKFEPYFSTTFEFEDNRELVERGVTPVIIYDSAGRAIRTDMPDGTLIRTEFDAWQQRSFDQNDTVLESQWYADRITAPVPGIATPEETTAANKAAVHANTPEVSYLDSLGRTFVSIADNGAAGKNKTTTETDIEGNTRKVTDAHGNVVMQYKYDMLGAQLYSLSMDAGERWGTMDVMGKPLRGFDSRGNVFRYQYDKLHRPVKTFMKAGTAVEINTEKVIYGEGIANDKANNLRGQMYQHFDAAGITTGIACDFKGNPLQTSRQLCTDYKNNIDWNTSPAMDATVFTSSSVFDALNRPLSSTSPDKSIYLPAYNQAGMLNSVDVRLRGASSKTGFVKDINYDVKGRRESIIYGNNTKTNYLYDPKTFRVTQIQTIGKNGSDLLQKLSYTYDPVGNITSIKDEAQQTIIFKNSVVNPSNEYTYDAIYRLISATGREHVGQNQPLSSNDAPRINHPLPGDGTAMRNYTQNYQYDAVGNILQMIHAAGAGSWTRLYQYEAASNRLNNHKVNTTTETFIYDVHGNIQNLAQLQGLNWNFKDQLQRANLGGGGIAYYVYDGGGERTRKVIERLDGTKEHRIYLGGFELYRKVSSAGTIQEETETLHVMDA